MDVPSDPSQPRPAYIMGTTVVSPAPPTVMVTGGPAYQQQQQQQVPIIIQQGKSSHAPLVIKGYSGRLSVALGATQTILGVLALGINALGYSVDMARSDVSHGIWGALLVRN